MSRPPAPARPCDTDHLDVATRLHRSGRAIGYTTAHPVGPPPTSYPRSQPMSAAPPHVPVMRDRVAELLATAPAGPVVDATLGAGGHALALIEARLAVHGRAHLVGLDRDPDALASAGETLARFRNDTRVELDLVGTRFDRLGEVLDELGITRVAGVLLDLGISSMHVDRPERGFSYRLEGPLDMRMDPALRRTAADLVNDLPTRELADLLRRYADERFAGPIARAIVEHRPIVSTTDLAAVVRDAVPHKARRTGGHPATRTFQALRIAVNAELEALEAVLPDVVARLRPDGVAVTLAYHSLEDRRVKRAFAEAARGCVCPPGLPVCACGRAPLVEHLVRRPERPRDAELAANPRASAARLRAVRRLPDREGSDAADPTHATSPDDTTADHATHLPCTADRTDRATDRPRSVDATDEESP